VAAATLTLVAAVTPTTYARWRATTLGRITEDLEVELVLELAGDLAGKRVLDVGTGDGTYALAAERGATVTGVDASREMLDAAAGRARGRGLAIDLREGDVAHLPFEDGSFDVVIAVTVLCFVSDPRRAVAEMARVLAPGGKLVIGELHRASTWAAWRRVKGWLGSSGGASTSGRGRSWLRWSKVRASSSSTSAARSTTRPSPSLRECSDPRTRCSGASARLGPRSSPSRPESRETRRRGRPAPRVPTAPAGHDRVRSWTTTGQLGHAGRRR
jgi:SAM-dependent methyltransferase